MSRVSAAPVPERGNALLLADAVDDRQIKIQQILTDEPRISDKCDKCRERFADLRLSGKHITVMPVSSAQTGGTGVEACTSMENCAAGVPFSMRSAPNSMISAVWRSRPVVSMSMTV